MTVSVTPELAAALAAALAAEPPAEADALDGRRRRAERGRQNVIASALELVNSGVEAPTIAEIAAHSDVSERTIFRYFPDREALFTAMATAVIPRVSPFLSIDVPDGATLEQRAATLTELRLEFVRFSGPFARSVERLSPHSNVASSILELRRTRLHEQVIAWLSPELTEDDTERLAIIDTLLTHQSIGQLIDAVGEERNRLALVDTMVRLAR